MKKLFYVLLCFCCLFSLVACATDKTDATDIPDVTDITDNTGNTGNTDYTALVAKARTLADTMVNDYGSTSVQYAIIDKGEIILSDGRGVYDKIGNRAITKDDMYGIGSTSKMFVTAAAMTLVDEGKLNLDSPLTDYIPEFIMADERYKNITPRMLMNHSSGIYGTSYSDTLLFNDPDTIAHDTLLKGLAEQRLKADPGKMFIYCNDGFSLLEILVERVSGISYTEFLAENFCKPLGLVHTKTPRDNFDRAQLVKAYYPLYDGALPSETFNALGTGGLYSTAEELCRFAEVLMGNKPEILSEQAASLMCNEEYKKSIWQMETGDNMGCIGLGWDTVHCFPFGDYGIQSAGKSGSTLIFNSFLVILPEQDIAMAVISSGGNAATDYPFISSVLQELLLQKGTIKEISSQRTFTAPVPAQMPTNLSEYSGLYATADSQFDVQVKDGGLTIVTPYGNITYVYVGDEVFKSEDGSESLKFVELSDGSVFIQSSGFPVIPGAGQLATCSLKMQRLAPASISQAILDEWTGRAGMKYYAVSEQPTSQVYFFDGMQYFELKADFSNGYAFGGAKIVNETLAVNTLKFRDVTDVALFVQDGAEYLKANDLVFVREDFITELNTDTVSCTIGADGYAQYFTIGTNAAGKTMTVNIPQGAAYAVYDENDSCIDFSTVTHNSTTVLPSNGKIAFIGKAGDAFGIELK